MADLNLLSIVLNGQKYVVPKVSDSQDGILSKEDYQKFKSASQNEINEIQLNGKAVEAVSKVINLIIKTGTTAGTITVGDADVLVKGLAALAFKDKVSDADLDTTLKEIINNVPTLKTAVETLNGTGEGSVSKQIDDKLTAWAELTTDNEKVDTFKELVNWVTTHGTEAAGYAKSIQALEALLKGIGGEEEPKTVLAAIQQALGNVDFSNYYTKKETEETFVKKDGDKVLSSNDFTNELKNKLDGLNKIEYSYDAAEACLTLVGLTAKVQE